MPILEEHVDTARLSPPGCQLIPSGDAPTKPIKAITFAIPTPNEILFAASTDRRLRFKRPIKVSLYREGPISVVHSTELQEFGYGDNRADALDDFGQTLSELYFSLQENEDRLGTDLRSQFEMLRGFVEPYRGA